MQTGTEKNNKLFEFRILEPWDPAQMFEFRILEPWDPTSKPRKRALPETLLYKQTHRWKARNDSICIFGICLLVPILRLESRCNQTFRQTALSDHFFRGTLKNRVWKYPSKPTHPFRPAFQSIPNPPPPRGVGGRRSGARGLDVEL